MSSIFNNLRALGDVEVNGNLVVKGTTTSVDSEIVQIADNHLYLNKNYETTVAQTGGLVVNYLPQDSTPFAVITGGFATSDTVNISAVGSTFVDGEFIQISGTTNGFNDGIYEVLSFVSPVLTIKSNRSPGNDFTKTEFVVDSTVAGTVTRVALSIIRAGTDGIWEVASGTSAATLSFTDLAMTPGSNDTFTNYAYLPGRVGGQILYGGTVAGNNLTLAPNSANADGAVRIENSSINATDKDTGALIVSEGGLGVELNVHAGGTITADSGLLSNSLNTSSATALSLGEFGATSVQIATSGVKTRIMGGCEIQSVLDTLSEGSSIVIGATKASDIQIAASGKNTLINGGCLIEGAFDTITATNMNIGTTTATGVTIGYDSTTTVIDSYLSVTGLTTFQSPIKKSMQNISATGTVTVSVAEDLKPIVLFSSTADVTYNLPDLSATAHDGLEVTFYKSSATGIVTIASHANDSGGIEGSASIQLKKQFDRITLCYVLTDLRWIIV